MGRRLPRRRRTPRKAVRHRRGQHHVNGAARRRPQAVNPPFLLGCGPHPKGGPLLAVRKGLLMSAAQQPKSGSVLDGKYALLRELGSGGSGTVYEAENLVVGKKVAIKLMNPGAFAEKDSHSRFVTEARAAARIAH